MPKLQLFNRGTSPVTVELIKGDAVEIQPGEGKVISEKNIRIREVDRIRRIGLIKAGKIPIKKGSKTKKVEGKGETSDLDPDEDEDHDPETETGEGGDDIGGADGDPSNNNEGGN